MFLTRVATVFRRIGRPPRPDGEDLLSLAQTARLLHRERARADRTGEPLSVVAFAPASGCFALADAALLVGVLRARLRLTDEAGWLDSRRICVVLPNTPSAGAWKVANDVCLGLPRGVPSPLCTVYVYPLDSPSAETVDAAADPKRDRTAPLQALLVRPMPLWKRGLDVVGAVVGLIVLAPLLAGIALAIKLASRGPVLFRQRRSGRGGQPFVMFKFRSMVIDAEHKKAELAALNERDGPAFKIKQDPRVTRLGRFLRSTSLDELPQLWNVLKGDMSLVGPRPLPCAESDACASWQKQRLDVTPGLTCIWQVRGRGGVSFADWIRMDVQYIRGRSLWQDLKLLVLTLPAVILRRGAH